MTSVCPYNRSERKFLQKNFRLPHISLSCILMTDLLHRRSLSIITRTDQTEYSTEKALAEFVLMQLKHQIFRIAIPESKH